MSSNVQAWRTPVTEPSGAYINSLVEVIQTCGWACASVALSIASKAASSKPSGRGDIGLISGRLLGFHPAAAAQQRIRRGLAATEGDIGLFRIARAAGRIDVVMQPLG